MPKSSQQKKSLVFKRSVVLDGHKTSVSLEDAFWEVLHELAHTRGTTLSGLITKIDAQRDHGNLSSALRLFVLDECQKAARGEVKAPKLAPDQLGQSHQVAQSQQTT